jgi:hypothetical protein
MRDAFVVFQFNPPPLRLTPPAVPGNRQSALLIGGDGHRPRCRPPDPFVANLCLELPVIQVHRIEGLIIRTNPSVLPNATRNPKCQGANSTHVTARLPSERVAFVIHLDDNDVPTSAHAPPPPSCSRGGAELAPTP